MRGDDSSVKGRRAIHTLLAWVVHAGVHYPVARYQVQCASGTRGLAVDLYVEILSARRNHRQAEEDMFQSHRTYFRMSSSPRVSRYALGLPQPQETVHKVVIDEPPPFLGTWRRVYIFVLCYLVFVIAAFYVFSRAYAP